MIDSLTGTHLGDPADDPDARRHARAVEVEVDLVGHDVGLLGDLARERALVVARLVADHGKRSLEGVSKVADVGACPLDDLLVGFQKRIELLLQRPDFLGQPYVEACGVAGANGSQTLLHLGERKQTEAHLEQGEGKETDARQRQGEREPRAEVAQARVDLPQRAGDGHRVALRHLAFAEHIDGLGDAQALLQRPVEAGDANLALVGLDVVLARQRYRHVGERARLDLAARPAVERLDLPVPAGMGDLEQRLAHVLGVAGLLVAVVDGVGQHDGEQDGQAAVEAGRHLLRVQRIDDGARDRQRQQGPGHGGSKQPEGERVSCHRPRARAGSRDRGWS